MMMKIPSTRDEILAVMSNWVRAYYCKELWELWDR